jgi:hypothetical protein
LLFFHVDCYYSMIVDLLMNILTLRMFVFHVLTVKTTIFESIWNQT